MKFFKVFIVFLRLGLTSFGGPIAHLSYFHDEFVKKKKWISEHAYADLVALCQFLPGPASSQVGMAIGQSQAGIMGAILAWIGFTLPSAIILILFGLGVTKLDLSQYFHILHSLKVIAVSVVAHAVYHMWQKLCPDKERMIMAILSAAGVLYINHILTQIIILVLAGFIGAFLLKSHNQLPHVATKQILKKRIGSIFLFLFLFILIFLPILRTITSLQSIKLFDSFYRAGSLVFGGGHVVLPLLQTETVPTGWVSRDLFMAGYGLAQAIPGPLFTFTAYLGAIALSPTPWTGAFVCLVAAFLPSFLLIIGAMPFWEQLRKISHIRQAMLGINASVVGILLAALYNPVWQSAIFNFKDFLLALSGFVLLNWFKVPSWMLVLIFVLVGLLSKP